MPASLFTSAGPKDRPYNTAGPQGPAPNFHFFLLTSYFILAFRLPSSAIVYLQLSAVLADLRSASRRLRTLRAAASPAVLTLRPAADRWSAAECVAHLNLTSQALLPLLRTGIEEARRLDGPISSRYRRDFFGWLIWKGLETPGRFRTKTGAAFVPSGDQPIDTLVAEFERLQAEVTACTRDATDLPIDRVKIVSPFNVRLKYNLYSALTILTAHQHRHLWQAEQAVLSGPTATAARQA